MRPRPRTSNAKSNLLPVPIEASNSLREDKIRLLAHDLFLLAAVHESLEVLGLGVSRRAVLARIPR